MIEPSGRSLSCKAPEKSIPVRTAICQGVSETQDGAWGQPPTQFAHILMCAYAHVPTCRYVNLCIDEHVGMNVPRRLTYGAGVIESFVGSDDSVVFEDKMSESHAPSPAALPLLHTPELTARA